MTVNGRFVKKWMHVDERGGDPWVLPIWASIQKADFKVEKDLSELGLHISTRLNFLPRISVRISSGARELEKAIDSHGPEFEFTDQKSGYAFKINNDLKYRILVDFDSFLFELNSLCDMMKDFFERLHVLADVPMPNKNAGPSIAGLLEDPSWFRRLDNNRNTFIHNAVPYFAVQLEPGFDLLFMSENLKSFGDKSKFLRLSELAEIADGFAQSKEPIQAYLCCLFRQPK